MSTFCATIVLILFALRFFFPFNFYVFFFFISQWSLLLLPLFFWTHVDRVSTNLWVTGKDVAEASSLRANRRWWWPAQCHVSTKSSAIPCIHPLKWRCCDYGFQELIQSHAGKHNYHIKVHEWESECQCVERKKWENINKFTIKLK